MRRTIDLGVSLALVLGSLPGLCWAECPGWDELLSEESVIPVRIERRSRGEPMFIAYINPPQLGRCLLGDEIYDQLSERVFKKFPNRHFFWIGGGHSLDMNSVISRTSMLQEGREFFFDLATRLRGPRTFLEIHTEILAGFDGELDFSEPVTIFFNGFWGTYSNEYWLPERYLPDRDSPF